MTKKLSKILAVLLAIALVFCIATFSAPTKTAVAENEVNYKKKVVSVVFDDSTSMIKGRDYTKYYLAKYSLQMLASMLGSQDELIVCPMAESRKSFSIDLSREDREKEIKDKIVNNDNSLKPVGTTPESSIDKAIGELEKRGLKPTAELGAEEEINCEYWLVMLTDGGFNGSSNVSVINGMIEKRVKNYSGLHTVYLSFGDGSVDLTDPNLSLNKNYSFTAHYVTEAEKVIDAMEDVSNKILGRYGIDESGYTINGNTVSVNLDKFEFSMNNVTAMVQNCGAKITKVRYNGKDVSPSIQNVIENCQLQMETGYIAQIKGDPYLSGGTLEIIYDKAVSNVKILVEPAIYVVIDLECFENGAWKSADMQYINSNLGTGDKIRVGYKVYNSSDGKEINTKAIFGTPTERVTYCNQGYKIGEEITLKQGRNEIAVQVTVLNGTYAMKSSLLCYIENDPTAYRIESKQTDGTGADGKTTEVVYTIFSGGKEITSLSDYEWSVEVTGPDGKPLAITPTTSGAKIVLKFDKNQYGFGSYNVRAKVVDKESGLSRVKDEQISILPKQLEVNCVTPTGLETTVNKLASQNKNVEFTLKLDGDEQSFDNNIIKYTVKIGGSDVTDKCQIQDGKLLVVLSPETVTRVSEGEETVTVSVNATGGTSDTATYSFTIIKSTYRVETVGGGNKTFDRYNVSKAGASVAFKVYCDEQLLNKEQLTEALDSGKIKIDSNPFGWITLLPCALDVEVSEIDGATVVLCKVVSDVFRPLDDLLGSFIFANEKQITLTYYDAEATDTVFMTPVGFGSRVIRWLIIIIILLIILHFVLFIVGFFVAKRLPRGIMLKFPVSTDFKSDEVGKVTPKPLNMKKEVLKWHLSRLIPGMELKAQKPVDLFNMKVKISEKTKTPVFVVRGSGRTSLIEYLDVIIGNKDGEQVKGVIDFYKQGQIRSRRLEVTNGSFLKFFKKTKNQLKPGMETGVSQTWYGVHSIDPDTNKLGSIQSMIVFIPVNRIVKRKK